MHLLIVYVAHPIMYKPVVRQWVMIENSKLQLKPSVRSPQVISQPIEAQQYHAIALPVYYKPKVATLWWVTFAQQQWVNLIAMPNQWVTSTAESNITSHTRTYQEYPRYFLRKYEYHHYYEDSVIPWRSATVHQINKIRTKFLPQSQKRFLAFMPSSISKQAPPGTPQVNDSVPALDGKNFPPTVRTRSTTRYRSLNQMIESCLNQQLHMNQHQNIILWNS